MRVTTDLAAGTTGLVSGLAAGAPAGASFAAKLADATDSTATTETSAKAETTRKVPGHSYEVIISGPPNGMFINRSGTHATARRSRS